MQPGSNEARERSATLARVASDEQVLPKLVCPHHPGGTEPGIDAELQKLQRETFDYFLHEINPVNGLVIDKTAPDWPASIAATGLALACYPVSVERGFMSRAAAVERTLTTLRFFWNSAQGPEPDATGYQGFYYHFLDMQTGRRAWQCELSTVDSTFLLAGALAAAMYFDADSAEENEIRTLGDALYRRANWAWALNGGDTVTHGWKPESGFLPYRWEGYDEALLLYVLGWARQRIRCPRRATRLGPRPTAGRKVTTRSTDKATCTRRRCSRISSLTSGSTFAASRTPSCLTRTSTISRTVAAPRTRNSDTRFSTRKSSKAMATIAGASPRAKAPAPAR